MEQHAIGGHGVEHAAVVGTIEEFTKVLIEEWFATGKTCNSITGLAGRGQGLKKEPVRSRPDSELPR